MEKELGCQLFDRSCNSIRLNDNGRKLQQSLRVFFEELDKTVFSLSDGNADTREIKLLVRAVRREITDHLHLLQTSLCLRQCVAFPGSLEEQGFIRILKKWLHLSYGRSIMTEERTHNLVFR